MTQTVVLFGANGGIGKAVFCTLTAHGYSVTPIDRSQINFTDANCQQQVNKLLASVRPSIVINCVGIFAPNTDGYQNTMSVNFGSNWNITSYYMSNMPEHAVKIIMIGSISYKHGKKWSMVYSASKAALFSLWQSAKDYFVGSLVTVDIVNPQRTLTGMTAPRHNPELQYHAPQEVADQVLELIKVNGASACVDMTFATNCKII